MTIETHSDVRVYFRERLVEALRDRRVEAAEATEYYLVNLLAGFAFSTDDEVLARPLVELLAEATQAERYAERLRRFRDLGDCALYMSGFFADNLERRCISRDYVVALGGHAYLAAESLVQRGSGVALADVYGELASRFEVFSRVLCDVRESTALRTPQDVVKLYERWRRTGSPTLAKRLEAEGVYPVYSLPDTETLH